jgi:hypothetical protein
LGGGGGGCEEDAPGGDEVIGLAKFEGSRGCVMDAEFGVPLVCAGGGSSTVVAL